MRLTAAEDRVLECVGCGLTAREIAEVLGCAETTVRMHLANTKRKLGAKTLAHAWALRFGRDDSESLSVTTRRSNAQS